MRWADALHVVGAAVLDGGRCLVARRGPGMRLPGKWEFPGGKVERGERPEAALARELEEELGLAARVGERLGRGDVVAGGERVVLDVYAASAPRGDLWLREHAEVRWVEAADLDALDWAAADVPVLPAVRARLEADAGAHRCAGDVAILAADWGLARRKRAVWSARRGGGAPGWRVAREAPPAEGWTLGRLVDRARRVREETGAAALIGIGAVLGVPGAYARAAGARDFFDALSRLAGSGGLREESGSAAAWKPERPFFRVPAGRGALQRFLDAAGGRSGLLRQVELRTGAKPVFALSGIPGTVGSGSRALWQELAEGLEAPERDLRLWPFDGTLARLTSEPELVLAEAYPRAAYGIALAPALPAEPRRLAKTAPAVRADALRELMAAPWIDAQGVELAGLDAARASEDDFDALMTAAALARLAAEGRPLASELVDPAVEGGILATGGGADCPNPR